MLKEERSFNNDPSHLTIDSHSIDRMGDIGRRGQTKLHLQEESQQQRPYLAPLHEPEPHALNPFQ
ncbi:uncharacterized protein G2W53_041175 [Senna tora]|uniref:Uncharacterized protein n=1 Tax=Senna tora TaxID=362788 RepID=A0A834SRI6_9FABA|nr:uncharacterized protein G2W53_041175 [Senna tora]